MTAPDLEQRAINVIRGLAMDAPHAARSGHQGTAMALAPLAHVLWTRIMRYDAGARTGPTATASCSRPGTRRSSCTRCSTSPGYDLTLDDLRDFRQWGSKTPGSPRARPHRRRRGHHRPARPGHRQRGRHGDRRAPAARPLRRRRRRPPHVLHRERRRPVRGPQPRGVVARRPPRPRVGWCASTTTTTSRSTGPPSWRSPTTPPPGSAPTAGTSRSWARRPRTSTPSRPRSSAPSPRRTAPSLLILRSHIAYPSPSKTDDPATHGYALKDDEIREAKAVMGLPDEAFYVPDDVRELYRAAGERGRDDREAWEKRLDAYDGDRALFDATLAGERPPRLGGRPPALGARREGRHPRRERQGAPGPGRPRARRSSPAVPTSRRTREPCSRTTASNRPMSPPAARCTSASASTRWPRR